MTDRLSGRIAVITGGARGIGYAIADRLLSEGARVAFCALRQSSVEAAVASLGRKGDAFGVTADLSVPADIRRFFAAVTSHFGGLDILVNNAAIRTYRPTADLDPTDWDHMLAVNLSAPFHCVREAIPIMKQRGGGDIINISSLSSHSPFAGGAGYNATKSGLNGLTGAAMLDYRYDNIRVSEILPGSTDTDFNNDKGQAWKVSPEDIAEAVVMLLCMPARTTVSRIDLKPSKPPRK